MVRAPCCEKMGLKKGPWTHDEDRILINHVTLHGHENWRALPKQAGLLRCGKSCRLRWTNYLRPDIKRGNFSEEEEETIINLHEELGNRWSAIAACLPGRTDNEIKNVWHTHLKKRIKNSTPENKAPTSNNYAEKSSDSKCARFRNVDDIYQQNSPQQQSSMTTTTTTTSTNNYEDNMSASMNADPLSDFLQVDDTFWSDVFSSENSSDTSDFVADNAGTATSGLTGDHDYFHLQFPEFDGFIDNSIANVNSDAMDNFWYDMLTNSCGQLPEL